MATGARNDRVDVRPPDGGDPACWAHLVCPACGRVRPDERADVCGACGAAVEED